MKLSGWLFDLDGTLVDTNALHVDAWDEVFHRFNHAIGRDRIVVEIGKGGDNLIPTLLGKEVEDEDGEKMREAHVKAFKRIARAQGINPAPDAAKLLEELRRRGYRLALATSSAPDHVELIEELSGVPWRTLVDEVTDSGDVSASKPAPDIIAAALKKLSLPANECVMVGDTRWDATAAKRANVRPIGVRFGGSSNLEEKGAEHVFESVAEILAKLDAVIAEVIAG